MESLNRKISPIRAELLRLLITSEPSISSKINMRGKTNKETPTTLQVCEDGTVCFYYGSGPLWWQRLFDRYEKIGILDVAINIADAITGSGGTRNEKAFDGITKSILDEAIKKQDYECVIDILFDSVRNSGDGPLHSKYINQENIKKYIGAAKSGELDISNMYGFTGLRTSDGRVLPFCVGRVVKVQK